jgi:hypothetical protein
MIHPEERVKTKEERKMVLETCYLDTKPTQESEQSNYEITKWWKRKRTIIAGAIGTVGAGLANWAFRKPIIIKFNHFFRKYSSIYSILDCIHSFSIQLFFKLNEA